MSFRKSWPDAPDGFFAAEAAGLAWLAAANGAPVVEVLRVGPDWIELAELPATRPTPTAAEQLGRALARTHAAGAARFGSRPEGYDGPTFIGRQELPCAPDETWSSFYVEQRVLPYLRRARDRRHVTDADVELVERACVRIVGGPFEPPGGPARLHGDLWNGNVLWTEGGAVLIDPAAHGGHPETDLAMLALFGIPHLEVITGSYAEAAGLTGGFADRVPVHQLHPLAVHAASHGSAYAEPLRRAAQRTLGI